MKSHDLKKALCQWTAMLALVVSGAVWAANGVDFSQSPEVSGTQEGAIRMPRCRKLSHHWRAAYQSYSLYGQRRQSGRGSGSASLFLSAMSRTAGRYRANRGEYLYPIKRLREIRGYYGKF